MPGKHAFLCYSPEDELAVDRLQAALETAGVRVWRPAQRLSPGDNRGEMIRQAITGGALVFVACFSRAGLGRERSHQQEELGLAVDQLRQRRPDLPFLIPVRLDDCAIPDLPLGGGRTLGQLHCADLFGERREQETARLVSAIIQVRRQLGGEDLAATSVPGAARAGVPGSAAPLVRFSLPPDIAAFTGHREEMIAIAAAVTSAVAAGDVVAIHAIDGMPGVGKTALAVHAARALAGRFPDRQLFVDLHAHTPGREPVTAADALEGLLAAAGVDSRSMPGDLDGRAALWRHRMAGQQALLVLDNAATSDQVAPLLPGPRCLVLVTSRRHLGDLPGSVTPVPLDTLPPDDAKVMFTQLAPRSEGDPGGVAKVVKLAGFLPLAISLLARVLARHPCWSLDNLADEIRAGPLTLTAEDRSIAAAFEVSYRHLDPRRQWFFRLLGVNPGSATDRYTAAALTGTSPAEAAAQMEALYGEALLTEITCRRYGMHDLIRRYACDLAAGTPADSQQALDRLLDYYQHTAALASEHLARQARPGPRPPAPDGAEVPVFRDAGQALAWMRAERASLLACLDQAATPASTTG